VFAAPILAYLPVAILFGAFAFLAISNLIGVQLVDRTMLLFKGVKHYPDRKFCTNVGFVD
jgi:hypothetical protein